MRELISVIIPMYNSEKTILNALESVRTQTYKGDFEIIVVDDGSVDDSSALVKDYIQKYPKLNIRLIHQENKGVSSARNTGLKNAKGEILTLLDSDDIWLPQKIERQLLYLQNEELNIDLLATRRSHHKILFP